MSDILIKQISSLDKVFLKGNDRIGKEITNGSMLKNERFSYQIMYISSSDERIGAEISVSAPEGFEVELRRVGNVPCELVTNRDNSDAHYLSLEPGLYPDPLYPMENMHIQADPYVWRSVWVTVKAREDMKGGAYPVEISIKGTEKAVEKKCRMEIELIDAALPRQELIHTEWFHSDCIASYYNVPVFSKEHWRLIEKFIEKASYIGINMILTPVFTPPLDTEIDGERPTVQLVKIKKNGDTYEFDFTLFEKWVGICQKYGIEYFEICHLFTQWGAKHAPKIIAEVNGEECRIFGWETDAGGEEYATFLGCFLSALINELKKIGIDKKTYFHISDEPTLKDEEFYRSASQIISPYLKDFPIIDALSNYEFYQKGLIKNPIPTNDHIEEFLKNNVPDLWTYYCCAESNKVSNRFIAMPSYRNRIIGVQFYKYDIKGFLQWGYNFYYSFHSKRKINPFYETDGGYAFPAGDAYMVYPYEDGPIESIRSVVFYEALQDLRALKLLESFIGKEAVLKLIEETAGEEITFEKYPHDLEFIERLRKKINEKIKMINN